jgi:hypothetical protein
VHRRSDDRLHLVRPSATRPALADLTEREREVLAMVAEGLSNSGIVALGRGHNRAGAVLLATGAAWFAGSFWDGALYLHRAGVVLLVAGVPAMQRPPVAAWPVLVLGFLVSVDCWCTATPGSPASSRA